MSVKPGLDLPFKEKKQFHVPSVKSSTLLRSLQSRLCNQPATRACNKIVILIISDNGPLRPHLKLKPPNTLGT